MLSLNLTHRDTEDKVDVTGTDRTYKLLVDGVEVMYNSSRIAITHEYTYMIADTEYQHHTISVTRNDKMMIERRGGEKLTRRSA